MTLGRRHRAPGLVACSSLMQRVESLARRAASTEFAVLITGETGTGKELVARTIHGLSGRARNAFLAVNCGVLRSELALSHLFGHRRGAFTGAHEEGRGLVETAHQGSLFLDEIGELSPEVQVSFLRFLESGEYFRLGEASVRRADVRIIAATNRDLRNGGFREDLLYRLAEVEIHVPPLRERVEDIVVLARHFIGFYGGIAGPRLTSQAEDALCAYQWPGNVRELENLMKRLTALSLGGGEIDVAEIEPYLNPPAGKTSSPPDERGLRWRNEIISAHRKTKGNMTKVAAILNISRATLYQRIHALGLAAHLGVRSRRSEAGTGRLTS